MTIRPARVPSPVGHAPTDGNTFCCCPDSGVSVRISLQVHRVVVLRLTLCYVFVCHPRRQRSCPCCCPVACPRLAAFFPFFLFLLLFHFSSSCVATKLMYDMIFAVCDVMKVAPRCLPAVVLPCPTSSSRSLFFAPTPCILSSPQARKERMKEFQKTHSRDHHQSLIIEGRSCKVNGGMYVSDRRNDVHP